ATPPSRPAVDRPATRAGALASPGSAATDVSPSSGNPRGAGGVLVPAPEATYAAGRVPPVHVRSSRRMVHGAAFGLGSRVGGSRRGDRLRRRSSVPPGVVGVARTVRAGEHLRRRRAAA